MIILGQEKPSLADLMQSGVKGMKWGVRKAKPTTSEIHDARARQDARMRDVNSKIDRLNLVSGPGHSSSVQKKAVLDFQKSEKAFLTNEDRVTAAHMTRGEKIAAVILAGPLGGAIILGNKAGVKRTARKTDVARQR